MRKKPNLKLKQKSKKIGEEINTKVKIKKVDNQYLNLFFNLALYVIVVYYMLVSTRILVDMAFSADVAEFSIIQFISYLLIVFFGGYYILFPKEKKLIITLVLIILMF